MSSDLGSSSDPELAPSSSDAMADAEQHDENNNINAAAGEFDGADDKDDDGEIPEAMPVLLHPPESEITSDERSDSLLPVSSSPSLHTLPNVATCVLVSTFKLCFFLSLHVQILRMT